MGRLRFSQMRKITFFIVFILVMADVLACIHDDVPFTLQTLSILRYEHEIDIDREECDRLISAATIFSLHQRAVLAAALLNLGCLDTLALFPEDTATESEKYIVFQKGRVLWLHGNIAAAIVEWRQVDGVDQWLIVQGDIMRDTDIIMSARWYEANIILSRSAFALAESITIYADRLRGRMDKDAFVSRIEELEHNFDIDDAGLYRLRGLCYLTQGNYAYARRDLMRAIEYGLADSETLYLLGEVEWQLGDIKTAESYFRQALEAPIQIKWRRAQYLYRLGMLLVIENKLEESIPFFEEAILLSDYYPRIDYLASIYQQLGDVERANRYCTEARLLADKNQPLMCEK